MLVARIKTLSIDSFSPLLTPLHTPWHWTNFYALPEWKQCNFIVANADDVHDYLHIEHDPEIRSQMIKVGTFRAYFNNQISQGWCIYQVRTEPLVWEYVALDVPCYSCFLLLIACVFVVEPPSLHNPLQFDGTSVAGKSQLFVSEDLRADELKFLTVSSSHSDRTEASVSSSAHESRC